jgi:hypothetical protein
MLPDDPVEGSRSGIARPIGGRWLRHAPWRGAPRATARDP